MPDLYGTHLDVLQDLFKEDDTIYRVYEDGGGLHSTMFFLTQPKVWLTTVEEDEEWREKIINAAKALHLKDGLKKWNCRRTWGLVHDCLIPPDLVLIDGPKDSRGNRAKDAIKVRAKYIVCHDWEGQVYYHYNEVNWDEHYDLIRVHKYAGKGTALFKRRSPLASSR